MDRRTPQVGQHKRVRDGRHYFGSVTILVSEQLASSLELN